MTVGKWVSCGACYVLAVASYTEEPGFAMFAAGIATGIILAALIDESLDDGGCNCRPV